MLGRRKKSVGRQVKDSVGSLSDRLPGRLDGAAAGLVALGMVNWFTTSLLNFDAVRAVAGRRSRSSRALYGVIGASGVYATLRGARRAA
jgi:uncharacterized membrane protein YuzA (DUF378 family)